jgi:acyl-[acyl-carrier-protein] desaturase
VAPVLRAWNVFDRTDLTGEGEAARNELAAYISQAESDVSRFIEKRDNHFDRLIARGQEPVHLDRQVLER